MSNLYHDAGPPASGQKVMLATPCYDSPDSSYTFSIARSREALSAAGIQSAYYLLQGNCHVDDARNAVARDFLASDCTDLIFLDADVSWEPSALLDLCRIDRDLVGAVYPFRRESPDENMPVRLLKGVSDVDGDGLLEVEGLPTGFMKIRRTVIERMAETSPRFIGSDGGLCSVLFERDVFGGGRRGGDIRFCMKWRELGGRVFAAPALRLGHCGKQVLRDTLGASIRRRNDTWLRWTVDAIRGGTDTGETYVEAEKAIGSAWVASAPVLEVATRLARESTLPVLEAGSGLSTICMAAATTQMVWSIEDDPRSAISLERMTAQAGVGNVMLVTAELKDGWYDLSQDMAGMPELFGLAFVDGPYRKNGDRMRFFDVFGDRCRVILCDDADDPVFLAQLKTWASGKGRKVTFDGRAAVILPKE